jgi:hypothetical protein
MNVTVTGKSKRLYVKPCESDYDYVRFARYYLAKSYQFDRRLTMLDTIAHLMTTLQQSRLLLFDDERGELAAYIQYQFEDDGATVFFDSAILSESFRGGTAFYRGFGDVVRWIGRENGHVRLVRFFVLASDVYLNRLYAKFATSMGEREGGNGREVVYETPFADLKRYLRADKRE